MPEANNLPQPLSDPVVKAVAEVLKSLDCHGNIRHQHAGIKAALVQLESDTRLADIETVKGKYNSYDPRPGYDMEKYVGYEACRNDVLAALNSKVRE
ncbi:MAG: hypothetical protein U1D67_03520 [Dehalococcoidia bacterium]|nr:hypothetical protein [Dehalococcoidia bacterium]